MAIEQKNTVNNKNIPCHHCGEACDDSSIHIDNDKFFCCQGCKMVFEILQENDLCTFYDIDEHAGISLKGRKTKTYAYLDEEAVQENILDYKDNKTSKVTLYLPAIHCSSCIWLLENLYKLNESIITSRVNFLKKEIYLTFTHEISLRQIVELLVSIGYEPEINLSNLDDQLPTFERSFYYKLGIAGFAFGNIMMFSFPEYLGLGENSDTWFQSLFGYLNILLATPVLLYSGKDYLISAWQGLKQKHLNIDVPVSLGMLSIFLRSVYEIVSQTGSGYLDSFAGFVFFLLIGKWFQQKTYHRLSFERDYKSYFPLAATLVKDGTQSPISVNNLVEGDVILVRHQELIPADAIMTKGKGSIDYSFVTGEAEPVDKQVGEKIFAGGKQMGEAIELTVLKKVSQSYLVQLWNDDAFKKKGEKKASELADQIGKYFTVIILFIALATLIYWSINDRSIAFTTFTAVLIVACPCAVALSIPFTFGNVLRILARHQFYLKNTEVIERLQNTSAIVFDKTGTITLSSGNRVEFIGTPLSTQQKEAIFAIANQSTHPMSRQIANAIDTNTHDIELTDFKEITGKGVEGIVAGIPVALGSATFIKGKQDMENNGVLVKYGNKILGKFILHNEYRSGFESVLSSFQDYWKTFLLSGDDSSQKTFLAPLFKGENHLLFRQKPKDKLSFVKNLQEQGERVIMLGDGLNDAGALMQSDVGIVISENINNFTPASDAILSADKFEKLPNMVAFVNRSIKLVYFAYALAAIYNIIGLSFAARGLLSPVIAAILMPLSSITIALFGVLSSSFLAKRMGL